MHHAERDNNKDYEWGHPMRNNDGITQRGIKEAEILSERLKDLDITAIISSPYVRCKHTAEIIAKYHSVAIIDDERFNERKPDESWETFLKRNMEAIDSITKNYKDDDTIICVTSGVNISAFMCYFYEVTPSENTPFSQAVGITPVLFTTGNSKIL